MPRLLDLSAFDEPVSRAEAEAVASTVRGRPGFLRWSRFSWISTMVGQWFLVLVWLAVAAFLSLPWWARTVRDDWTIGLILVFVVAISIPAGGGIALVVWIVRTIRRGDPAPGLVRVTRFARRNGLRFDLEADDPSYPGLGFSLKRVTLEDRFTPVDGGFPDYGTAARHEGKNGRWRWTYLVLKLERSVPNMVLRAKRGPRITEQGAGIDAEQRFALEGDFNETFTLYCPAEYERDALYIFTPDLMALLMDEAAPFDVELVDGWMIFHCRHLDLRDPDVHERMARIAALVGEKAIDQTERYADFRVEDRTLDRIHPKGRRLRARPQWIPILAGLGGVALVLLLVFGGAIIDEVLGNSWGAPW